MGHLEKMSIAAIMNLDLGPMGLMMSMAMVCHWIVRYYVVPHFRFESSQVFVRIGASNTISYNTFNKQVHPRPPKHTFNSLFGPNNAAMTFMSVMNNRLS